MSDICKKSDPEGKVKVEEIVREWNNVSIKTSIKEDPSISIFKFMTYWISFNLLYCEKNYKYPKSSTNGRVYLYEVNIGKGKDNTTANKQKKDELLFAHLIKEYGEELINSITKSHSINPEPHNNDEKLNILLYTDSIMNKLIEPSVYNRIMKCCNEISKQPVIEGTDSCTYEELKKRCIRLNKRRDLNNKVFYETYKNGETKKKKVMSLIMIIYQIRCNLFHGAKRPEEKMNRDMRLVSEAASIMQNVIEAVLNEEEKTNG